MCQYDVHNICIESETPYLPMLYACVAIRGGGGGVWTLKWVHWLPARFKSMLTPLQLCIQENIEVQILHILLYFVFPVRHLLGDIYGSIMLGGGGVFCHPLAPPPPGIYISLVLNIHKEQLMVICYNHDNISHLHQCSVYSTRGGGGGEKSNNYWHPSGMIMLIIQRPKTHHNDK